ncbi:MAG: hypothetical protein WKF74_07320 [Pyrinomonadaceae bacterium]
MSIKSRSISPVPPNAPHHPPPANGIQASLQGHILRATLSGGRVHAVVMLQSAEDI